MHTPTVDHDQHRAPPGSCPCTPAKLCPECMGKLQRARHEWALKRWIDQWDHPPPRDRALLSRPHLRLVHGGR